MDIDYVAGSDQVTVMQLGQGASLRDLVYQEVCLPLLMSSPSSPPPPPSLPSPLPPSALDGSFS